MKRHRAELPVHILKEYLRYDAKTGEFTWIKQSSYRGKVGAVAGGRMTHGYISIRLKGVSVLAHRAAWAIHYGYWSSFETVRLINIKTV